MTNIRCGSNNAPNTPYPCTIILFVVNEWSQVTPITGTSQPVGCHSRNVCGKEERHRVIGSQLVFAIFTWPQDLSEPSESWWQMQPVNVFLKPCWDLGYVVAPGWLWEESIVVFLPMPTEWAFLSSRMKGKKIKGQSLFQFSIYKMRGVCSLFCLLVCFSFLS